MDDHLTDDKDDVWNFERMPYEVQEFYCETAYDIWFQEYVPEFEGNEYDACVNPNGTSCNVWMLLCWEAYLSFWEHIMLIVPTNENYMGIQRSCGRTVFQRVKIRFRTKQKT